MNESSKAMLVVSKFRVKYLHLNYGPRYCKDDRLQNASKRLPLVNIGAENEKALLLVTKYKREIP